MLRSMRLRLELASQAGNDTLAAEISKRLAALRSARSFVDWQRRRDFVKDLDLQRAMIVDRVAQIRPDLALELMWRFMGLAEPVLNRVDDSNGSVGDVFRAACQIPWGVEGDWRCGRVRSQTTQPGDGMMSSSSTRSADRNPNDLGAIFVSLELSRRPG